MYIAAVQTSSFSSFMQLIGVLIIFLFVLAVTYVATRWIAGYQKEHSYNKNLKIIETLRLTTNKYIQIVQAGEEYLVIAIGKDEVRLLTKLTQEQLRELPSEEFPAGVGPESFKELLEKFKKHIPKK
ncbi:MAG: flagellar biosynthetic protein FliO [Eubacterium sp.]|nr:flagellar biosynthetic protein FliO [Eubacterium sp.]